MDVCRFGEQGIQYYDHNFRISFEVFMYIIIIVDLVNCGVLTLVSEIRRSGNYHYYYISISYIFACSSEIQFHLVHCTGSVMCC